MPEESKRSRIETEALVTGYAMSRLDEKYLAARGFGTWAQAYAEAAQSLIRPATSFNNLRDEFDPVHPNARRGWHQRTLRPDRLRVLNEMQSVSDEALLELVARILRRDEEATAEAIDSLAVVNRIAHNVAERLLTGRLAEEYFQSHSEPLVQVVTANLLDYRNMACGYDFGVRSRPEWAIEVKGIKETRGGILFTDREWSEARERRANYWVVVVGNLVAEPIAKIIQDPHANLKVTSALRQTIVAEWRSTVSLTL